MNKKLPPNNTCMTRSSNEVTSVTAEALAQQLGGSLRLIAGYSELLLKDHSSSMAPEATYLMRQITQTAFDMERSTRELANASSLNEQSTLRVNVEMNELIARVMQDMSADQPFSRARFHIDKLPSCTADPRLLRQVFLNLVRNAVKFSRNQKEPAIEIGSLSSEQEQIYFVRDNGIGFGKQEEENLFKPFGRLHAREGFEGNGLGLFIAKILVEKMEGHLWAEATVNQGATFYISLPCQRVSKGSEEATEATKTVETGSHLR